MTEVAPMLDDSDYTTASVATIEEVLPSVPAAELADDAAGTPESPIWAWALMGLGCIALFAFAPLYVNAGQPGNAVFAAALGASLVVLGLWKGGAA